MGWDSTCAIEIIIHIICWCCNNLSSIKEKSRNPSKSGYQIRILGRYFWSNRWYKGRQPFSYSISFWESSWFESEVAADGSDAAFVFRAGLLSSSSVPLSSSSAAESLQSSSTWRFVELKSFKKGISLQGDQSGLFKPPVDIKSKVPWGPCTKPQPLFCDN